MQIVAIISGKGGVGKSMLAANIGAALAQRKKRVLLIDLDPQNALRLHLGMDPDEIAGLIREGITPTSVFDSPFGVKFIPFGRGTDAELEEFETVLKDQPEWLASGIESLDVQRLDFILLDTPPGGSVFLQQALRAAHRALAIVLPDAASYASIPKITSLVAYYTQGRPEFAGMHLLINQMPSQSRLGHQVRSTLYAEYARQLVPVTIHKDARVSQALACERPVIEYAPDCKTSMDIQDAANWLIDSTAA